MYQQKSNMKIDAFEGIEESWCVPFLDGSIWVTSQVFIHNYIAYQRFTFNRLLRWLHNDTWHFFWAQLRIEIEYNVYDLLDNNKKYTKSYKQ